MLMSVDLIKTEWIRYNDIPYLNKTLASSASASKRRLMNLYLQILYKIEFFFGDLEHIILLFGKIKM